MQATGEDFVLLLGASRGLGQAVGLETPNPQASLSRRSTPGFDFSKPEVWPLVWDEIVHRQPQRIWYFAGGGPHGPFGAKAWRDHQWAFRVCFECPAFLLHKVMSPEGLSALPGLKQFIVVGSAVAGEAPDPLAASYSAAKHALRGLVTSIQAEAGPSGSLDLRLFSPTYLDTPLLPPNAEPRQTPGRVRNVQEVANEFVRWAFQQNAIGQNLSHNPPLQVPPT